MQASNQTQKLWQGVDVRLLPDFATIGAMKSGTTSLYRYLSQHPDIYLPEYKEPGMFLPFEQCVTKVLRDTGLVIRSLSELIDMLRENYNGEKIFGDGSAYYTKIPFQGSEVPLNMYEARPDMKIMYILRNPFDRIISHYRYTLDNNPGLTISFDEFLVNNVKLVVQVSRYAFQLSHFFNYFPGEQFLVLTMEKLATEPEGTLREVCEFLNVDSSFDFQDTKKIYNKTKPTEQIDTKNLLYHPKWLEQIAPVLYDDIDALKQMTGYDFNEWDISEERWAR